MNNGPASVFVEEVDFAFWFITTVSLIFLVFITGFMIFSIVKYNKKNNPIPSNVHGHTGLEIVWTIIPTVLVMLFFYFGLQGFLKMRASPKLLV
jgi:cytochrome c oxidase subunit 2